MSIQTVQLEPKQPYEIVPYQIDFAKVLPDGETLNGIGAAVYLSTDDPSSFTDLASTMVYATSYSGTIAQVDVQGGTDGLTYILRIRLTTTSGRRYEGEGKFKVKEN